MTGRAGAPFDGAAEGYDSRFTDTRLGELLRDRVWTHLDRAYGPGDRVLELGCGTGVDAVHLAGRGVQVTATDTSRAMLDVAARRTVLRSANDLVCIEQLDMNRMTFEDAKQRWPDGLDGVYSSFGGLNCVADRRRLALALSSVIRAGGRAVLVVMGPVAVWEMGWHVAHGQFPGALRRLRSGAWARVTGGSGIRVWYPSPARLRSDFHPWFRPTLVRGVGVILPPSGLATAMEDRTGLIRVTDAVDRRLAGSRVTAWLGDHYLMELVRA